MCWKRSICMRVERCDPILLSLQMYFVNAITKGIVYKHWRVFLSTRFVFNPRPDLSGLKHNRTLAGRTLTQSCLPWIRSRPEWRPSHILALISTDVTYVKSRKRKEPKHLFVWKKKVVKDFCHETLLVCVNGLKWHNIAQYRAKSRAAVLYAQISQKK